MDNILIACIAILNIAIGVLVMARNYRIGMYRAFSLFTIFLGLWVAANFLENEPNLVGSAALPVFLMIDFALAILFFAAWFYFCVAFLSKIQPLKSWQMKSAAVLMIAAAVFSGLSFSDLIVKDITFDEVIIFGQGILLLPYLALILFYSFGGLLVLGLSYWIAKRKGLAIETQQGNLLFWGFLISIINTMVVNFSQSFYPISLSLSRFGLYSIAVVSILSAYAIIKHRLFDVKMAVLRTIIFSAMVVFTSVLVALILTFFGIFMFGQILPMKQLFGLSVVFGLIMPFTPALYGVIKKLTKKLLFYKDYDPEELMDTITHRLASTIEIESLSSGLLDDLKKALGIGQASLLISSEGRRISRYGNLGVPETKFTELFNLCNETVVIFDNLHPGSLKAVMRNFEIGAIVRIKIQQREAAMLVLGPKLSGGAYFQKDVRLLETLSAEIGMAVQNAESFSEIKKFNEELEIRVADRTQELKNSQEKEIAKANELAKLKDEFVFIAAHELKTPVAAIRGFLDLLKEEKVKFSKSARQDLEAINSASSNLNQLVHDLLEVSRSDSGLMKIALAPVDAMAIIDAVIKEMAIAAKQRRIKITVERPTLPPFVLADVGKLREIAANLVSNAVKYNHDGGWIDISVFPQSGNLIVEVRDSGIGIPKTQRDQIFQKFFRADNIGGQEVLGTGLGLFITKMLCEKMGGEIDFSSAEGQGSTFAFSLPLVP